MSHLQSACRIVFRAAPRCSRTLASEASSGPSTRYTAITHTPPSEVPEALALANKYILGVYARPDFVLTHGKGSHVWDTSGQKYLDFTAGIAVNSLGHADEGVIKVMQEQSASLLHTSNVYHNEWAPKLAQLLVTLTQKNGGLGFSPGTTEGGAKVFFANSGTEANEGALKIARKVGKDRGGASKTRITCFKNAFHGRTMGALSVTPNNKYQGPFVPLIPGIDVGEYNNFPSLESLITSDTCAVIVEPIQGEGGVNPARAEWLATLRARCDSTGAVLIFDEIQCGLYRSGTLWAHSALPVEAHPDIITMAKPLANGYPIGAVFMRDNIAETMTPGTHGTTFGGSPLACAIGHHVLSRLSSPEMRTHVASVSAHLHTRLEKLPRWFPQIFKDAPEGMSSPIRGRGMIYGLPFRNEAHPADVVAKTRERGLFVLTAGSNTVRILPSLTVTREEVDFAVDVLESVLGLLKV
ncbi:acetylornithine and succinylornithine aminotransferase [Fistulina hepatica ATCC 64428]|uniref:acetylornithine transaminase n=1 Tax=Fistulina hepatica ATCC 64428 TaxID=1128425 RepID=A0A0D7A568_9AGAR|nr:acetylornithine and succinylornithine aminotransferase [Fistulina hepatica ATCC 64428]